MCLSSYRLVFCVCWMNWFFWRTLLCVQKICFRMELSCASSDCWFKVMNRAGEVNRQSSVLYLISVIHHTTSWNRCLQLFHPENSLRIGKMQFQRFEYSLEKIFSEKYWVSGWKSQRNTSRPLILSAMNHTQFIAFVSIVPLHCWFRTKDDSWQIVLWLNFRI